ncbi:MAG: hypothetical protein JJU32_19730 [Phormidium sp. BM_Day4_Bin.17]|nr:hypothetical protein [Phormidium sp. BM_Day4_Bin.17]UCJ10654.1 MAG: hypothetical protein JWS08_12465 [Phormidium sp. PBR-2020]
MNITVVSSLLIPYLPALLKKVSESELVGSVGELGQAGWERACQLWQALQPKLEKELSAKMVAEELAKNPEDDTWKKPFEAKLAEMIEKDPQLKEAIAQILAEAEQESGSPGVQQTIGEMKGGQAIGNMSNSKATNVGQMGDVGRDVNFS